jgi:hypothetical protein
MTIPTTVVAMTSRTTMVMTITPERQRTTATRAPGAAAVVVADAAATMDGVAGRALVVVAGAVATMAETTTPTDRAMSGRRGWTWRTCRHRTARSRAGHGSRAGASPRRTAFHAP